MLDRRFSCRSSSAFPNSFLFVTCVCVSESEAIFQDSKSLCDAHPVFHLRNYSLHSECLCCILWKLHRKDSRKDKMFFLLLWKMCGLGNCWYFPFLVQQLPIVSLWLPGSTWRWNHKSASCVFQQPGAKGGKNLFSSRKNPRLELKFSDPETSTWWNRVTCCRETFKLKFSRSWWGFDQVRRSVLVLFYLQEHKVWTWRETAHGLARWMSVVIKCQNAPSGFDTENTSETSERTQDMRETFHCETFKDIMSFTGHRHIKDTTQPTYRKKLSTNNLIFTHAIPPLCMNCHDCCTWLRSQ